MKHILPIFLIMLIYSDAFAIVGDGVVDYGCGEIFNQTDCNANSHCWWNTWTSVAPGCVTCNNTMPVGAKKTEITYSAVYNHISDMSGWIGKNGTDDHVFCPYELTCTDGVPEGKGGGLERYYDCGSCQGDTLNPDGSNTFLVTKQPTDGYTGVLGFEDGSLKYGNVMRLCTACGTKATSNSEHTNCDCELGYQTEDGKYTNVGTDECSEYRVYNITLYPTNTTLGPVTIRYRMDKGYDVDLDEDFNDVGDLIYKNILYRIKYELVGWSPDIDADPTNFDGFKGNTLKAENNNFNIAYYCANNEDKCDYDSGGYIRMYSVWKPKEYKVIYRNNQYHTEGMSYTYGQEVKVLSQEDLDTKDCFQSKGGDSSSRYHCDFFGEWVPDGYQAVGWQCDQCETSDILKAGDVIPGMDAEYNDDVLTLTAKYSDCPVGYYCTNNEKHKCPAGSTSSPGAKSANECYLEAGFTSFCKKGTNNCIDTPMDWDCFLKYQGSSEQN